MAGHILGLVLAGGRSSRMGAEKAFVALAGRPLIAHVLERLAGQTDKLAINANGDPARFSELAIPVLADDARDIGAGPLAGIAAGLAFARTRACALVATVPCDAPFLPRDLVFRLASELERRGAPICVAEGPHGLEPLCALWRVDLSAALREAITAGERSPRRLMEKIGAAPVRFSGEGAHDPFANLNSPAELEAAAARINAK
jgi:molybdenum cofactor guanylyltransferase